MGPQQTAEAVRSGAEAAFASGFRTELDVARYVHLAFAFRSLQFDQLPWARAILAHDEWPPRVRMNRLFEAGCEQLAAQPQH
jgi:hypothetical protein